MTRLSLLVLAAVGLWGCGSRQQHDDTAIKKQISDLETHVTDLNAKTSILLKAELKHEHEIDKLYEAIIDLGRH